MTFPVFLHIGPVEIHPHLLFEVLAYTVAFRIYLELRRRSGDHLQDQDRWWVIAAAATGALLGSKLLFLLEDPHERLRNISNPLLLPFGKTIVGALIGGLFCVEFSKRLLGITLRTGDLFALPLCVGIAVGRIGCFLTGLSDQTYGVATSLPWGINLGDGVRRHPTQLYEIVFLLALTALLVLVRRRPRVEGDLFKIFMVGYLAFRLCCDFLKPEVHVFVGLSSIQYACVLMLLYYSQDIVRWIRRRKFDGKPVATGLQVCRAGTSAEPIAR